MKTQEIKLIENCFSTKPVDLSNSWKASAEEHAEFLDMLSTYKMQSHVELHAHLHNEGYFIDKLEAETGCPF